MILRDRAPLQVAEIAQMENTTKLLEFWGSSVDVLQRRVLFDMLEACGQDDVAKVVAPLLGLQNKAEIFNSNLSRLQRLSLGVDHRHSPGFVVAEMLAEGLLHDDEQKMSFALHYVQAFQTLDTDLRGAGQTSAAVRKEISDRANMSDGATCFLAACCWRNEFRSSHAGCTNRN